MTEINPVQAIRDHYNDPEDSEYPDLAAVPQVGGISADGSTIIGSVYRSYENTILSGFAWTAAGGVNPVGDPSTVRPLQANQYYTATGISADGNVIVGQAASGVSGTPFGQRAYRWTSEDGFEDLGSLDDNPFSAATAVSGDGTVVVGHNGKFGGTAFRWSEQTGLEGLGWLEGGQGVGNDKATAVSYDGSVIVGYAFTADHNPKAFRWTQGEGMVQLPTLAGGTGASASGVSWDGATIVGSAASPTISGPRAVRWVGGEIFELGDLPTSSSPRMSEAHAISGNGDVIVGNAWDDTSFQHGFRWTQDGGMVLVEQWLDESGAEVPTDQFGRWRTTKTAEATNEDGSVVVGLTHDDQIYIARGNGTGPTSHQGSGGSGSNGTGSGSAGQGAGGTGPSGSSGTGGTGSNTPGSNSPAGGAPGGTSGIMTLNNLNSSLQTSAAANTSLVNTLGVIVNGAGSRPLDRRAPEGNFTTWLGGDWGRDDHGTRDGNLGLGEIGLGYNWGPIQLNGVAGYTGLTQNTPFGGTNEVGAGYVKLEALGQITGDDTSGLWAVVTGTGLWGEADITRNYQTIGGLLGSSAGTTSVEGYGLRARLQWENLIPHISPYGEVSFAHTCLGAYSETGGAFPATFTGLCDGNTEIRYGFDAQFPVTEQVRAIGTLEGVHRMESSGANVTGRVNGLGAFDLGRTDYQQDWLRAGVGFEVDFSNSTLAVMGNATTSGESSNAWIAANWSVTF